MNEKKIEDLMIFMCNSFIDKAMEYVYLDFEDYDDHKLAMISSSLSQASVKFTVYMLSVMHGQKLTLEKEEFVDEVITRFNENLSDAINEELHNKAKEKEVRNDLVFLDILKGRK